MKQCNCLANENVCITFFTIWNFMHMSGILYSASVNIFHLFRIKICHWPTSIVYTVITPLVKQWRYPILAWSQRYMFIYFVQIFLLSSTFQDPEFLAAAPFISLCDFMDSYKGSVEYVNCVFWNSDGGFTQNASPYLWDTSKKINNNILHMVIKRYHQTNELSSSWDLLSNDRLTVRSKHWNKYILVYISLLMISEIRSHGMSEIYSSIKKIYVETWRFDPVYRKCRCICFQWYISEDEPPVFRFIFCFVF